jgi:hypothetical protein
VLRVYDLENGELKKKFPYWAFPWGPNFNSRWDPEEVDVEGYFSRIFHQAVPGGYAFNAGSNEFLITEGIQPYDPPKPRGMDEGGTRMVKVVDLGSGTELARFNPAEQPFLAPDGKLLAFTTPRSIVLTEMPPNGSMPQLEERQRGSWSPMIWSSIALWIGALSLALFVDARFRSRKSHPPEVP